MEYYLSIILIILYKIIVAAPSIIVLIALLNLNKKFKFLGLKIALVGQICLSIYVIVLKNGFEFYLKEGNINTGNIEFISILLNVYLITFSLIFSIGFFLLVSELLKKSKGGAV